MSDKIPLHRFLQQQSAYSRRRILALLEAKEIRINNQIANSINTLICTEKDSIYIQNKQIQKKTACLYFMYHKPANMLTSMSDPKNRTCIGNILKKISPTLFPIGRLDKDTTGLILVSNDGDFSHRLAHPKYKMPKRYCATFHEPIKSDLIKQLETGLFLEDGPVVCFDCEKTSPNQICLSITEGRNRILRRCFEHLNLNLSRLHRISIGPFHLGKLPCGDYKELSTKHVQDILTKAF